MDMKMDMKMGWIMDMSKDINMYWCFLWMRSGHGFETGFQMEVDAWLQMDTNGYKWIQIVTNGYKWMLGYKPETLLL